MILVLFFLDVVHAYKGLQTEKTALEQSVKALSVPTHHPPATQPPTHPPDKQDTPAKNAEDGNDEKDHDQVFISILTVNSSM